MRTRTPSQAVPTQRRSRPERACRILSREPREDELNRRATELMVRYRDTRDPEAFELLYVLSRESVLTWIKSLRGREHVQLDPLELLQDTFINVYRYPSAFRDDHTGSFRVWVRTIAGNVLRRSSAERSRTRTFETDESLELVDRTRGPVQVADEGEATDRLRRAWVLFLCLYAQAWNELSPRDRQTLQLVEVEGLSYQEAGERLAVGRSNMKMIVFRSRKRIARRMREALGHIAARSRSGAALVA